MPDKKTKYFKNKSIKWISLNVMKKNAETHSHRWNNAIDNRQSTTKF